MPFDRATFDETLNNARGRLLAARNGAGHWEGELSSSALSTATALFALHQVVAAYEGDTGDRELVTRAGKLIRQGLAWLALHQNTDGGWGDTTRSFSNISTTALCWSAFVADENWAAGAYATTLRAVEQWLVRHAGSLAPEVLANAIADRYGEDRTFSVPILTMMALAGRLGPGPEAWDLVPALPFELAAFPQRWFKWLRLPVVSYALPALVAIGQVRHALRPSRSMAVRTVRSLSRGRTLRLLRRIQPASGGFLEATPLTSFVVMSLAAAGRRADDPVVRRGVEFLARSARPDGSWPIDTNLATWVTTLSINALAHNPDFHQVVPAAERAKLRNWLLVQQYRTEHPYTLADPGGWAWTDLPGGVPDADDTPGALLALRHLGDIDDRVRDAAAAGVKWMLGLQNRDGGIPTFCRGWGKLPFDRSSPDLTAHALRAWSAWSDDLSPALARRVAAAARAARLYLRSTQGQQGHWVPLWFGNQHAEGEENPTYGTSRVLLARPSTSSAAVSWLVGRQNADGGWGGAEGTPSSIEETALAIEALSGARGEGTGATPELIGPHRVSLERGVAWLIEHTDRGRTFEPSPIGFYFAKLWYWDQLYPLIWTVGALEQVAAEGRQAPAQGGGKYDVMLCATAASAVPN